MDSIFPENNKSSEVSNNSKTEMLLGNELNTITSYGAIPQNVSKDDVQELAKKAGNLDGDILLMKLWSEQSLSAQTTALSALDIRTNHASQSMKNEQSYKKKIAKHGKNIMEHRLINQTTQSNYDGFQSALNAANETIAL
jgi:capsid protein